MTFINEKVVETKQCKHCDTKFEITDKDLEFYEKVSPVFAGKKYNIPTPTLCPECRQQRRLSFRNERNLYKRKCDFSGENIISQYSSDSRFPVYSNGIWFSDSWNANTYAIDYDLTFPFFDQLTKLTFIVPKPHTFNYNEDRMENSLYTNCAGDLKNCHLIFGAARDENCYYSSYINDSKNCVDCHFVFKSENCYNCIDLLNCFSLISSLVCQNCSKSIYLKDCINCNDCIGCIGLRNSKYFILNKEYSKEEYETKKQEFEKENFKVLKQEFQRLLLKFPNKYSHGEGNYNVTGDYISNSKNCFSCFDTTNAENSKYCAWFNDGKSCYDFFARGESELCYEVVSGGDHHYHCSFTNASWGCNNCYYCDLCMYCKNCFGCVGLQNQQYCILNKQYTKEEYEILVPKIIEHMMKTGEWGEFFPSSISPFGYNETVAQEYFLLTKEEAEKKGFNWSNYEAPFPKVEKVIKASMLPENISDIPDDILNRAIESELESTEGIRPLYRIIKQELEFYRKHNLPIPKRHPDQRHLDRMALRNPRKLFDRKCDKCEVDMKTTYSPERPEKVYCEDCYNSEVY